MHSMTASEQARWDSKHDESPNGGCWLWLGPLDRDGYGSFYFRRRLRRAHRFAWWIANGDIPAGCVVNHNCRVRNCVNPQHLSLYTAAENTLRDSKSPAYVNSRKTHCPKGHAYDKVAVWGGKKQRYCSTCLNARQRQARAKRMAEPDRYAI